MMNDESAWMYLLWIRMMNIFLFKKNCLPTSGLYMIGYGTVKIILKFPPFCQLNEEFEYQSNVTLCSNWNVFVCVFVWISRSWSSLFEIQKGGNFKIIFPFPYPIIYNPGWHIRYTGLFKRLFGFSSDLRSRWIRHDLWLRIISVSRDFQFFKITQYLCVHT